MEKKYYNVSGKINGEFITVDQFNSQKEALDLANELNSKYPDLYFDWHETTKVLFEKFKKTKI
jgi:hypothetical protein